MTFHLSAITAALFDMDGVLYRGDQALPGVNELLHFLDQHGIAYACITNNASRTPDQIATGLQRMGLHVPSDRIITSATATAVHLRNAAPRGTPIHILGMDGLRQALLADDYFVEDDRAPEYVVVGIDFELTYAKLRDACLLIRQGATFIGTNPDTTFPAADGIIPGAGAILAALTAATAKQPLVIGKPAPGMFTAALELLGTSAAHTLMVGDRYDTDILGAARAGLPTALVLTGVSDRAEAEDGPIQPDLIIADLIELRQRWIPM